MKACFKTMSYLVCISVLSVFLTGCPCDKVPWSKIYSASKTFVSMYNSMAKSVYPLLDDNLYEKVQTYHSNIKTGWELVIKSLCVVYNNKDAGSDNGVIKANLAGVTDALNSLIKILPIDDKWKTVITITVDLSINIIPALLPKVEFTSEDKCKLEADTALQIIPMPAKSRMKSKITVIQMSSTEKAEIDKMLQSIPADERTSEMKKFLNN